jgi:hypothetical protein
LFPSEAHWAAPVEKAARPKHQLKNTGNRVALPALAFDWAELGGLNSAVHHKKTVGLSPLPPEYIDPTVFPTLPNHPFLQNPLVAGLLPRPLLLGDHLVGHLLR